MDNQLPRGPSTMPEAIAAVLAKVKPADPEAIAAFERDVGEATNRERFERRRRHEAAILAAAIPLEDGILPRLGRAPGDNPPPLEPWPSRHAAAGFVRGPARYLALLGGTGTGKTTAAAAAAFSRLDRGPVVYVRERMLERWCSFARYDKEWTRAVDCATLIVDELGTVAEARRDSARQALLEICDARQDRDRRTIVIGNLTEETFAAYIDPRLLSRWHHLGLVAYLVGEDRRLRQPRVTATVTR